MFRAGHRVKVYRANLGEWISGMVMERRTRDDGTPIYYVQVAGYVATPPHDPNVWFTADQMRHVEPAAK
jgi:hypothetical protein